jgi:excisionase family DNA binding protein
MNERFRELVTDYSRSLLKNQVIGKEDLDEFSALMTKVPEKEHVKKPEIMKLFTRQEVSDAFQLSVRTIDRMTKKGQIPSVKIGNAVRYRPNDINGLTGSVNV